MSKLEILICKLVSVNALSTSTIELSEVSSLHHKTRNYSVEDCALEVKFLAITCGPRVFSCTKLPKVLGSLWNNVFKEFKSHSACRFASDLNFKEDSGILWVCGLLHLINYV